MTEEVSIGAQSPGHSDMAFTDQQVKLFQYVMLAVLFAAAMILPGYGLKKYDALTAAEAQTAMSGTGRQGRAAAGQANPDMEPGNTAGDENTESIQKGTIVLDPGHGGNDPGMVGVSGISEKVLNLIYAKKLAALLEADGYRVVLTRTTEDGLYDADEPNKKAQDMQRRCALIEREQPLLTVSIHQNSYPADASVRGPQVFYYRHSAEGQKLAVLIQDCMNEQLEIGRPRVQKANDSYYILKRSVGTTALVEFGFLTNPEEEALLREEDYQDRAVRAVRDGILLYLNGETG